MNKALDTRLAALAEQARRRGHGKPASLGAELTAAATSGRRRGGKPRDLATRLVALATRAKGRR